MKKILLILLLLCLSSMAQSAVLFQDDYESNSADWDYTDGPSNGWGWIDGCDTWPGFGPSTKIGSGRGGGKAFCNYFAAEIYPNNGYQGEHTDVPTAGTEIYHRWYMNWPAAMDKTGTGAKLWRWTINGSEIYLDLLNWSGKISTAQFAFLPAGGGGWIYLNSWDGGARWLDPSWDGTASHWMDGQWHCHEMRIKLNTVGQSNGVLEYWFDGDKKYTDSAVQWGITSGPLSPVSTGLGNYNGDAYPWDNAAFLGICFDDIVYSTTYIGPAGDTAVPSKVQGLTIQGGSVR